MHRCEYQSINSFSSDKYNKHFLLSWKLIIFFSLRFPVITLPIFLKCVFFSVTKEICGKIGRGTAFQDSQLFLKKIAIIVTEQMLYRKGCLQIHCKLITSFLKYIEKFSLMSEMKYL